MHKIERDIGASHFIMHLSYSILSRSLKNMWWTNQELSKRCSISFLRISTAGLSSMRQHDSEISLRGEDPSASFLSRNRWFHMSATTIGSRVAPTSTTRSRSTLVNARYRGRQSRVVGRVARYCFTSSRVEVELSQIESSLVVAIV